MIEARLNWISLGGHDLEEFDFDSYEQESLGFEVSISKKGSDATDVFFGLFVTVRYERDIGWFPGEASAARPGPTTIIIAEISKRCIEAELSDMLSDSFSLGWPACIDRLREKLTGEFEDYTALP